MTTKALRLSGWISAALLILSHPVLAQRTAKEAETVQKKADYQKAFGDRTMHHLLDPFVGTFEATLKTWGHGTPPVEGMIKQTVTSHWAYDAFLVSEVKTRLGRNEKQMAPATFDEVIYRGYNPGDKRFSSFRISQGDPREFPGYGRYDEAAKSFTFEGSEKDPVTGDSFVKREVYKVVSNDRIELTVFYRFQDGSEVKAVEGPFLRVTK
jgi:hypothetical protein